MTEQSQVKHLFTNRLILIFCEHVYVCERAKERREQKQNWNHQKKKVYMDKPCTSTEFQCPYPIDYFNHFINIVNLQLVESNT